MIAIVGIAATPYTPREQTQQIRMHPHAATRRRRVRLAAKDADR